MSEFKPCSNFFFVEPDPKDILIPVSTMDYMHKKYGSDYEPKYYFFFRDDKILDIFQTYAPNMKKMAKYNIEHNRIACLGYFRFLIEKNPYWFKNEKEEFDYLIQFLFQFGLNQVYNAKENIYEIINIKIKSLPN